MSKSKIIALTALIILAFGMTTIGNAVADQARNETYIERNNYEIWGKGNLDLIDELVAPNYVRHLPWGQEVRGREGYKQYVTGLRTAFPDVRFNMDIMISEGDYVMVYYSGIGTHSGQTEVFGPPTGKKITFETIVIHRLAGGKIVEDWEMYEGVGFMEQFGYKLVPPSK